MCFTCVGMYVVCISVCMRGHRLYVCPCVYTYMCLLCEHLHVRVPLCSSTCVSVCEQMCLCLSVSMCMYTCMSHTCLCVSMSLWSTVLCPCVHVSMCM